MLYLLFGENSYKSSKRLSELKDEFLSEHSGSVKVFDAEEEDDGEFITNADSLSIFDQKRLLVLKRVFSSKASFQEKVSNFINDASDLYLIIWEPDSVDKRRRLFKMLKKKGVVEEFGTLSFTRLKSWLSRYIGNKINYDPKCIDQILLKIGEDQMQIASTVDNLIDYVKADGRKKITLTDVNKFIEKTAEEDIWEFIDALSENNRGKALEIVERLILNKGDFIKVVGMIARQLRILSLTKWLLSKSKTQAQITKKLKLHPFVVRKALMHSRNFDLKKLRKLFQKLTNTDFVVKTGKFEEKLALDLFIAAL